MSQLAASREGLLFIAMDADPAVHEESESSVFLTVVEHDGPPGDLIAEVVANTAIEDAVMLEWNSENRLY